MWHAAFLLLMTMLFALLGSVCGRIDHKYKWKPLGLVVLICCWICYGYLLFVFWK